jgi:hypothetical protein
MLEDLVVKIVVIIAVMFLAFHVIVDFKLIELLIK